MEKIKDAEYYKVYERVFNQYTITNLAILRRKKYFDTLDFVISTGKEADVYRATAGDGYRAIKIYKIETTKFKSFEKYLIGDPRFEYLKGNRRALINYWCKKEYSNLLDAYSVGVRVPRPYKFFKNILIMEFIGENGMPAPRLHDFVPENIDEVLNKVYQYIKTLKEQANIVHGDINEFNILILKNEPVIIDIAQGVKKGHPMYEELWERDLKNIKRLCKKYGVDVPW